jgi:hypothetical protein
VPVLRALVGVLDAKLEVGRAWSRALGRRAGERGAGRLAQQPHRPGAEQCAECGGGEGCQRDQPHGRRGRSVLAGAMPDTSVVARAVHSPTT